MLPYQLAVRCWQVAGKGFDAFCTYSLGRLQLVNRHYVILYRYNLFCSKIYQRLVLKREVNWLVVIYAGCNSWKEGHALHQNQETFVSLIGEYQLSEESLSETNDLYIARGKLIH